MTSRTNRPFAEEVTRLLDARGLSIRTLASQAGVSQSYLSRLLRHADYKKTPSLRLSKSVAEALNLPPDYFREYREAVVIERVRKHPKYRDELFDSIQRK